MDWPLAFVVATVVVVVGAVLWKACEFLVGQAHETLRSDEREQFLMTEYQKGLWPAPVDIPAIIRETGDAIAKSVNPPPLAQIADEDSQFGPDDDTADALEGVEDWTEAWLPTDPGDGPKVALRAGDDGGPGIDWGPDS